MSSLRGVAAKKAPAIGRTWRSAWRSVTPVATGAAERAMTLAPATVFPCGMAMRTAITGSDGAPASAKFSTPAMLMSAMPSAATKTEGFEKR